MTYDPFWGTDAPIDANQFLVSSPYMDAGFEPAGGSYFSSMDIPDSYWMPSTDYGVSDLWGGLTSGASDLWGSIKSGLSEFGASPMDLLKFGGGALSMYLSNKAREDALDEQKRQYNEAMGLKNREFDTTRNTDLAKTEAIMNLLGQRQGVQLDPRRYAEIVASGKIPVDMMAGQNRIAIGGERQLARGGLYAAGGPPMMDDMRGALSFVRGGSPGQADDVNASLSHGEYVMDADVVSALGDGNTEAGAQRLDEMREAIRRHKRSAPVGSIPPPAKGPLQYLKGAK